MAINCSKCGAQYEGKETCAYCGNKFTDEEIKKAWEEHQNQDRNHTAAKKAAGTAAGLQAGCITGIITATVVCLLIVFCMIYFILIPAFRQ
ncbi:MAG: hypothetical protein MJ095_06595 [Oscillospiraceae bacterium]|nr:hypothetical protein [Oscillospiraceae bacterium]